MYRSNPDEKLRQLERLYQNYPTTENLIRLNSEKERFGLLPELGIEHLKYLTESVANLIGAELSYISENTTTWDGDYHGIQIHINARRIYGNTTSKRHPFVRIGRRLSYFETTNRPSIVMYADSEPLDINLGVGDDMKLSPHQPWMYDPQLFLDYLMELNQRMEDGEWHQSWKKIHEPWIRHHPRRNPISRFLTPEESDREINEKALPIFHDFRYRESEHIWHRTGNPNEFSEFTFCPSKMLGAHYCSPRMTGTRGSGIATGQYSYCSPRPDTIEVAGPKNPFIVSHKDEGENPAYRFSRLARTLLRMAETVSGKHDWTQKGYYGSSGLTETPFPGRDLEAPLFLILGLREHRYPKNDLPSYDELGKQITSAVIDWRTFKQVHPLNILLSRLGFDGISWAGDALEYGDCGDYGCLLFPPITYMGEVVGLNPTRSIYMRLPE